MPASQLLAPAGSRSPTPPTSAATRGPGAGAGAARGEARLPRPQPRADRRRRRPRARPRSARCCAPGSCGRTIHLIPAEDAGWLIAAVRRRDSCAGRESGSPTSGSTARPGPGAEGAAHGRSTRGRADPARARRAARARPASTPRTRSRSTCGCWRRSTAGSASAPTAAGRPAWCRRRDWLGELERRSREDSLAELARRYLRAYGAGHERDFARWAGLPLRDCAARPRADRRRAARRCGRRSSSLLCHRQARRRPRAPVVRMLGAYDNYNLGYESRDFTVDPSITSSRWSPAAASCGRRSPSTGGSPAPGRRSAAGKRLGGHDSSRSSSSSPRSRRRSRAEVADIGRFEDLDRDARLIRAATIPRRR